MLSPVTLRPPPLLIHAVSDGRRLGLQLHSIPGMGRALSKAGAGGGRRSTPPCRSNTGARWR